MNILKFAGFFVPAKRRAAHIPSSTAEPRVAEDSRRRELEAVLSVANLLAQEGTLSEKITRAMHRILEVSVADGATYRALRPSGELEMLWTVGDSSLTSVFQGSSPIRPGGIVDRVLRSNVALCEDSYATRHSSRSRLVRAGVGTVAAFPVTTRHRTNGVIVVACRRENFGEDNLSLVAAIANYVGAMIEQATLLEAERQRAKELSALLNINRIIAGVERLDERAHAALGILTDLTGADRAVLRLARGEDRELELIASAGQVHELIAPLQTSPDSISNACYASGQTIVRGRLRFNGEPGSVIAMPMSAARGCIGVVAMSSATEQHFTTPIVALIEPMVTAMGAMIEAQEMRAEIDVQQALADRRDTFIATASHELRTPMSTIIGMAELLIHRDPADSNERQKWYGMIHRESIRLSEIVSDMLDVTRIQSGTLQMDIDAVRLDEVIDAVVTPLRESTDSHALIVDLPDELPPVAADSKKLVQVLLNLVSNAIKYSPSGGEVRIGAGIAPDSGQVVVSVSDQGMGIDEEGMALLFEPFGRVRNDNTAQIRGTGLGLYISKNLVEGMGGQLVVESVLDEGSTFRFDLPLAA